VETDNEIPCTVITGVFREYCGLEMCLTKCVIVLFLFLIGVRIIADMEVTWKHPKDG
jgi:hypothetical protein